MGFGGRTGPAQPTLAVSTLEGVLKYIESKKPTVAPAVGNSRRDWRAHLDYFAHTGKKTDQLARVSPSLYPVLAAYAAGEPVAYKGYVHREGDVSTLAFCDPSHLYSLPPHEPVKSNTVSWKHIWTTNDMALQQGEPNPTVDRTRDDPEYLGTLVVREYYEDGVLVEQCTQFLPKF